MTQLTGEKSIDLHPNKPWQSAVDQLVADRGITGDEPGLAVLVLNGEDSHFWVRGLANLETRPPITANTNFRLASVAKQFTAACILQLRDQNRLQLTQRLADFFPDFPACGAAISVEHLLRHISGVKDYEPLVEKHAADMGLHQPIMDAEVLQLLVAQNTPDFEPGSRFRYSNSGYALLAMIVETVSGQTFPDYLKANIFQPLGMTSTLALVNRPGSPEVPNRAIGYKLDSTSQFVWSDQGTTSAVIGDGGIYCSLTDYEKWIRAYWDGRILQPETVREAWQPTTTTSGETVPYGYGWRLAQQGSTWRPYHPGSTTGFRNGVVVVPEKKFAALVLSNRCNGDSVSLATDIERVVCGLSFN